MFKLLWNKLFGLKCPTPGCRNRLKQVKESSRPMGDQFYCKRCDITYTGSQLKQFRVNGYHKVDPTGRRRQEVLQVPYDCPVCYDTFSMSLKKSEDVTAVRFLCPICKHYFPNPKYVKPDPPIDVIVNTLVPPEQAPFLVDQAITFTLDTSSSSFSGFSLQKSRVPNPAEEFVPWLNLCETCSKEFGECDGQPTFDGETNGVIECVGCAPKEV
jgi:uncharacterized protein YbaR (Trm112 family)